MFFFLIISRMCVWVCTLLFWCYSSLQVCVRKGRSIDRFERVVSSWQMLTFSVVRIDAKHQGEYDTKGKQRFKTRSTANNVQSDFLLHSKRKQIQKKKTLKSGKQKLSNFELFLLLFTVRLCCFLVTIVSIVVLLWGTCWTHVVFVQPFDCFWFCRCFLFVCCCLVLFLFLIFANISTRVQSSQSVKLPILVWFPYFFVCFVLIMIELLLPNYLILNFCFANQKGQTEKGVSSSAWNRKGPKLHRAV